MAKPRNVLFDYFVYMVLRFFVAVLQTLSIQTGYSLAHRLSHFIFWINRRHRNVALANLQAAFPQLTRQQREHLTLKSYEHFLKVCIEIVHLPRLFRSLQYKRFMIIKDARRGIRAWLNAERPCIAMSGHLGNWELSNFFLGAIGLKSFAVARTLDNPFVHRFLLKIRQGSGQVILSKNGDYDLIQQVLKEKKVLCTLGDQAAGPRGYFVDFFGRPASTNRALALLSLEYDAPIIVTYACRTGPGMKFEGGVAGMIDPRDFQSFPDAPQRMTAAFTAALEQAIRRYPEQYFWLHNRWKHLPPQRKTKAA